jgi:Ca2+-binding RTX toxin-like protein
MADGVEISVLRSAKGAVVRSGDRLGVLYSGSLVNGSGVPFDANYDFTTFSVVPARQLFSFTLGSGQVIQGWDQALVGRRLGEVLDLTIPAALAYGSVGAPPSIPPDSPLRFRVELVGAIPAGTAKPIYPSYGELGLPKKLTTQLDALKLKFGGSKIGTDADDTITGGVSSDLLIGLAGQDVVQGGGSADVLIGGPGSNRFVYAALTESPAQRGKQDQILGFQRAGDVIDLSALGETFTYIGKNTFSRDAGEVRFAGGSLQLDADGNGRADLEILLPGVNRFSGTSLLL